MVGNLPLASSRQIRRLVTVVRPRSTAAPVRPTRAHGPPAGTTPGSWVPSSRGLIRPCRHRSCARSVVTVGRRSAIGPRRPRQAALVAPCPLRHVGRRGGHDDPGRLDESAPDVASRCRHARHSRTAAGDTGRFSRPPRRGRRGVLRLRRRNDLGHAVAALSPGRPDRGGGADIVAGTEVARWWNGFCVPRAHWPGDSPAARRRRSSVASSTPSDTPCSRATSRSERPLDAASFTISVAAS